jgi:hypothetical protein
MLQVRMPGYWLGYLVDHTCSFDDVAIDILYSVIEVCAALTASQTLTEILKALYT